MAHPVKVFHSGQNGAPVLNGTLGTLVALLDACLVNGWGLFTPDSITFSGGVATVNYAAGHNRVTGDIVLVAGATQTAYNGEQKITVTSATQFTFPVSGSPATPATGTITIKVAPAGWVKQFSGTDKAAYKSGNPAATGCLLRVDDTGSGTGSHREAIVYGCETMTDVDTFSARFPTAAQHTKGLFWRKSLNLNSTATKWRLVADDCYFYFFPYGNTQQSTTYDVAFGYAFGDIVSDLSGDAYHCMISGSITENTGGYPYQQTSFHSAFSSANTAVNGMFMARAYTQIAGAVNVFWTGDQQSVNGTGTLIIGGVATGFDYPSVIGNRLMISALQAVNPTKIPRGRPPGLYQPLHARPLGDMVSVDGDGVLLGRKLMGFRISGTASNPPGGEAELIIDVTGPWR
jgi:hypothetical protein